MGPNEFQLRAALQEGEGDAPDADALISHAVGVRQERRRRITAIAGSTVVVAAVALGVTGVLTSNGSSSGGGGAAADAGGAARTGAVAAKVPPASSYGVNSAPDTPVTGSAGSTRVAVSGPSDSRAATAIANRIACPATPDRFALPGGGGSGQFGSTDPLFAQKIGALRICGYPVVVAQGPQAVTVSGAQAQQIAQQLDAEPATRAPAECAPNADYLGGTLEVYPVTTSSQRLRPVVVTLGCDRSEATNGTAVRYVSNLPMVFMKLVVPHPVSHGMTPHPIQGSPVR